MLHKQKILLVEDEIETAEIIRDYLDQAHYSVQLFNTGVGVVEKVKNSEVDLILLDIMLPGVDGTTICREIRTFSDVPIIMLTARVDEVDRLIGYEIGADDYICKPVNPREILVRVKAVLRRGSGSSESNKPILKLNGSSQSAVYKGKTLNLTSTEIRLLTLLSENEGKIFTRTEILDLLSEKTLTSSERSVDTCVKKLRKKMETVAEGETPIRSVYGMGYKFEI